MKIIVISTEFVGLNGIDVDSRLYTEDLQPILGRGGVNLDKAEYHLGQVSSSFGWALIDCSYQNPQDHLEKNLDRLFPTANGHFEFEYRQVKLK